MIRKLSVILFLTVACGCADQRGGTLQLAGERTLESRFAQAYLSNSKVGSYEVVLVDDASDWNFHQPRATKKMQTLDPVALAPVRQAMHLHLHWRPPLGTLKNPAAINATVVWYVFGADGTNDLLVYEGAAFVVVEGGGGERLVQIRDGEVKLKSRRGEIVDPVGSARITGDFHAKVNDARVQQLLAEIGTQGALSVK